MIKRNMKRAGAAIEEVEGERYVKER